MSEELAFAIYTGGLILILKLAVLAAGYFSVRMGYQLILAGAEGKFHFKAEWQGAKADLASVSPGLLFVILGCWLCAYALYVDKPVYFERGSAAKPPAAISPDRNFPDMPGLPAPSAAPASGARP